MEEGAQMGVAGQTQAGKLGLDQTAWNVRLRLLQCLLEGYL